MIKNFKQFESVDSIDDVLKYIKDKYNENYINEYIMENFYDYCDDEEMEDSGYDDQAKYYREMGAGGNGIEYDLIQDIWYELKEKFNIDLSDKKYEDLKYSIEYHINEFFPYFEVVDYRKKNSIMNSLDKWDL